MAEFYVQPEALNHQVVTLLEDSFKMDHMMLELDLIQLSIFPDTVGRGLKRKVGNLRSDIKMNKKAVKRMADGLGDIYSKYMLAENKVCGNETGEKLYDNIGTIAADLIEDTDWLKNILGTFDIDIDQFRGEGDSAVEVLTKLYVYAEAMGLTVSKEEHYSRNDNMPISSLPQTSSDAYNLGWNGNVPANCHQFTAAEGSKNIKYVSPDGHYEAIYDNNTEMIVTADEDVGTYNYEDPNGPLFGVKHFFMDVLPWYIYGNSENDSSTIEQRIVISLTDK